MKTRKSAACILSVLFFFTAAPAQPAFAGNAEETPGCQLQTILIDNDGKNLWTTESWGGANILPNTSWTTTDASDYYYNGVLSFEAKSNGAEPLSFMIGLSSHLHADSVSLYWTDLEQNTQITTARSMSRQITRTARSIWRIRSIRLRITHPEKIRPICAHISRQPTRLLCSLTPI